MGRHIVESEVTGLIFLERPHDSNLTEIGCYPEQPAPYAHDIGIKGPYDLRRSTIPEGIGTCLFVGQIMNNLSGERLLCLSILIGELSKTQIVKRFGITRVLSTEANAIGLIAIAFFRCDAFLGKI